MNRRERICIEGRILPEAWLMAGARKRMTQPSKVLDDLSQSGYQFLISDVEVGLTLARIASRSAYDLDRRIRNVQNARRAYDKVQQLLPHLGLNGSQQQTVTERLHILKSALEKLGEQF
jgi:hypothetical protein